MLKVGDLVRQNRRRINGEWFHQIGVVVPDRDGYAPLFSHTWVHWFGSNHRSSTSQESLILLSPFSNEKR